MKIEQAKRLAAFYSEELRRIERAGTFDSRHADDYSYLFSFALRLQDLPAEKTEKAMRWLGFIQGALWALGSFEIFELKRHSKLASEDAPIV